MTICCCNDINDVITNRPPAESWRHNDVTKWRPRDGQCLPDWWTLTWGTALSTGVISRLVNCGQWREKLSQVVASWWTAKLMTSLVIIVSVARRHSYGKFVTSILHLTVECWHFGINNWKLVDSSRSVDLYNFLGHCNLGA